MKLTPWAVFGGRTLWDGLFGVIRITKWSTDREVVLSCLILETLLHKRSEEPKNKNLKKSAQVIILLSSPPPATAPERLLSLSPFAGNLLSFLVLSFVVVFPSLFCFRVVGKALSSALGVSVSYGREMGAQMPTWGLPRHSDVPAAWHIQQLASAGSSGDTRQSYSWSLQWFTAHPLSVLFNPHRQTQKVR